MAEAMTGSALTIDQRDRLAVLSDGNPFHVEELVRSTDGAFDALDAIVPSPVERSMLNRLDGLEPVARQAACRAAIIGREVPVDQLAGLMGWDHADTVRHVNTLVAVGLLEDADGGRLRLVHELARRAVGSQLVAVERVNPHREIRSFLTQRIDTPDGASTLDERTMADVARHAYEGQDWSDAVRHGTVVARAVLSRWSAATAAAQLDRVVDAAERGHIELGADVHVLRARARRLVGELVGARDDLAMAVTVADAARDPAAS